MTPFPILQPYFSALGTVLPTLFTEAFFLQELPRCSKSLILLLLEERCLTHLPCAQLNGCFLEACSSLSTWWNSSALVEGSFSVYPPNSDYFQYLLQEIKMMIYQLLTSTRLQERRDMGWFHMSKEVQLLPRIRTDLCLPVRRLVRFLSSPTYCWILCALFMQLRSDRGKSWRLYAARTSLNKSLFFIYKNRLF